MTFDEAKKLKNSIGEKTSIKGIAYEVWLTPELEEDFMRFLKEANEKYTGDERAQVYASNDKYLVRAISSHDAGLVFKILHSFEK